MAVGTCLGWSSAAGSKLEDKAGKDTPLSMPINSDEASWIGSLVALGALIGKQIVPYRTK